MDFQNLKNKLRTTTNDNNFIPSSKTMLNTYEILVSGIWQKTTQQMYLDTILPKRRICPTFNRPINECGCPDCGSSLTGGIRND